MGLVIGVICMFGAGFCIGFIAGCYGGHRAGRKAELLRLLAMAKGREPRVMDQVELEATEGKPIW